MGNLSLRLRISMHPPLPQGLEKTEVKNSLRLDLKGLTSKSIRFEAQLAQHTQVMYVNPPNLNF
jgi:hypothetical protein